MTSVSKKSSVDQSELEKWVVSDCKADYMLARKHMSNLIGLRGLHISRNLEVDGCLSKENLFGQSALLLNATNIAFPEGDL